MKLQKMKVGKMLRMFRLIMKNETKMNNQEKIEKYESAWEKFQNKMAELRKRRHEILVRISEKFDRQKMEDLRRKIQDHE